MSITNYTQNSTQRGHKMINVTDENFTDVVLKSKSPSLVMFSGKKCSPCKAMKQVFESTDFSPYNVCYIDVENASTTCTKYSIMSVPTLLLFNNGRCVSQYIGKPLPYEILNFANKALKK